MEVDQSEVKQRRVSDWIEEEQVAEEAWEEEEEEEEEWEEEERACGATPAAWLARVQELRVRALEAEGGASASAAGLEADGAAAGVGSLAEARAQLSALRLLAGDVDGAAQAAQAALEEADDEAGGAAQAAALTLLGLAEAARGRGPRAEAALEAALERQPRACLAAWRLALLRRGRAEEGPLRAQAQAALCSRLEEGCAAALVPRACRGAAPFSPDLLLAPRALRALRAPSDRWAGARPPPSPASSRRRGRGDARRETHDCGGGGGGGGGGGWPRAAAVDWRAAAWATVLHAAWAWPAAGLADACAALEAAAAGGARPALALLAHALLSLEGGGRARVPSATAVNRSLRLLHAAQALAQERESATAGRRASQRQSKSMSGRAREGERTSERESERERERERRGESARGGVAGEAALEACQLLYRVQAAKAAAGVRDGRLGEEVARLALAGLRACPGHAEALRVAAVEAHGRAPRQALRLYEAALGGLLAADLRWARAAAAGGRERPVRHAALRQWFACVLSDRAFVLLALHAAGEQVDGVATTPGFEGAHRLWTATCRTIGLDAHEVVCLEAPRKRAAHSLPEAAAHDLAAAVGLLPERSQPFRGLALAFAALDRKDLARRCSEHSAAIEGSAAAHHELDEHLRPGSVSC